jgi:hypothetical protein
MTHHPSKEAVMRIQPWKALPVAAAVIALAASGCLSDDADPTPAADETEKSNPTAADFPNLTETFVSPRNGFSVKYFDRGKGTLTPAKDLWDPGKEQADDGVCRSSRSARCPADVVETGFAAQFHGASAEIPDGVSIDEWVDDV